MLAEVDVVVIVKMPVTCALVPVAVSLKVKVAVPPLFAWAASGIVYDDDELRGEE